MSNHENEIQFESYLNDVKETVDTPSDEIRKGVISEGIGNLRSRIGKLDIQVNSELNKDVVEETRPRYQGTELADTAVNIYKTNIKVQEEEEKESPRETVNTKATRENTKATIRALAGMRGSGDDGKRAPNANMSGSGSTGGYGPSNVVIPPLSMEDYKAQIFKDFGLISEESYEAIEEIITEENEEFDLISELETNLMELTNRSWIEVDRTTRQLCLEHGVLVKDVNKEFRSRHGMFPDKWIKEQVETEQCGWIPLDEMSRINKVGQVYDVTFMFRGGTQRFKFFWPSAARPSRADMQLAVEKFYPKARLIAFYPSMTNDDNFMVVVPPMTESYEITSQELWVEMTEEQQAVYDLICEEEGEPTSFPFIEEDGSIVLYIEDHDTGEEKEVIIEKRDGKSAKDKGYTLRDWFKGGGWKQTGGKYDGKPCAKQPGQTTKPYCRDADDRAAMSKDERNKRASKKRKEDPNAERSGKAINVRQESAELEELKCWDGYKRKKGAVPGTKGSCVKEGNEMKGMSQKSGDKRSTKSGAGMTAQGVAKYNRRTGGNLKTAVTTPPSKLKPGSKAAGRRKSFCARSRGWTGERGKAARRRWNC